MVGMAGIAAVKVGLEGMIRCGMCVGRTLFSMRDVTVDAGNALLLVHRVRKVHAHVFVARDTQLACIAILRVAAKGLVIFSEAL